MHDSIVPGATLAALRCGASPVRSMGCTVASCCATLPYMMGAAAGAPWDGGACSLGSQGRNTGHERTLAEGPGPARPAHKSPHSTHVHG